MRIAILGTGFSGLALAWHLLNKSNGRLAVTLFDPNGVGGGASGISVGLVHPFSGAHAKLNWRGYEGWAATKQLLDIAASTLKTPVADFSGILRLATTDEQLQDYALCAKKFPHVTWKNLNECQALAPCAVPSEGIWIDQAAVVDSKQYLKGLWLSCEQLGATFYQENITQLSQLSHFDAIIVAIGAATKQYPELAGLPLNVVKGQVLELEWPEHLPPLNCAVNSYAYFIMHPNKKSCYVGATYERGFGHPGEDPQAAISELSPKIASVIPGLEKAKILSCRAGLRATAPNYQPIGKQVTGNTWVLAGMGSKGLLYHALFASELADQILLKRS